MDIATTTLSSKGQIIIPQKMRSNFRTGEQFLIFQENDSIVLRKTSSMKEKLQEDLEFEKRTREAIKEVEAGNYIRVDSENLEEEMDKW